MGVGIHRNRTLTFAAAASFVLAALIACVPPQYRGARLSYGPDIRRRIVEEARHHVGTPYRYGGVSPRGFDCSGLVLYVYRENGITLPRSAGDQFRDGRKVTRRYLRPGDLVFFQTSRTPISHVGIYAGRGKFIHAPKPGKKVSYARLDNRYWSQRYRGAVTYL